MTDPARDVSDADDVRVDGSPVGVEAREVWVVNKPAGVVSTAREPGERPAVVELVDSPARLYPVGRLDADSTGLLLLTNDGELANRLTHPRYEVAKAYRVRLLRPPADRDLERLRRGVELEDGPTAPAEVTRLGAREIEIVLREGRNRQVRRMAEAIDNRVQELRRVRFGSLPLHGLAEGESRRLSDQEVARLWEEVGSSGPRLTADRLGNRARFGFCLHSGHPKGREADPEQFAIPPSVSLEGDVGGVEVAAVRLEDEFLLGPEKVDLDAAVDKLDRRVAARHRQASPCQQRQDHRLQRALQPLRRHHPARRPPLLEENAQGPQTAAAANSDGRVDRSNIKQPQGGGPLEQAAERAHAERSREVDKGPCRAGAGNAIHGSHLSPGGRTHVVSSNPGDFSPSLCRAR